MKEQPLVVENTDRRRGWTELDERDPRRPLSGAQAGAVDELLEVVRTYLK